LLRASSPPADFLFFWRYWSTSYHHPLSICSISWQWIFHFRACTSLFGSSLRIISRSATYTIPVF
jgi:hypothetical protein